MRWLLAWILTGVLFSLPLRAVDPPKQQEATRLLEQAAAKTNIFALPSFELKADIQMDNQGKPVRGTYQFFWNGPDQWREEITLPGYSDIQVGAKGSISEQRSTDFIPTQIRDLHQALGFGSSLGSLPSASLVRTDLSSKDVVQKVHRKKRHGEQLTCFEIADDHNRRIERCINDSAGTVAREDEDRDFQPVGDKVFPRILASVRNGKRMVEVKIWELSSPAQFPPDAFTAPAGVAAKAGCMNPVAPRLVQKRNPQYPDAARMQRVQGTVSLDALIGTDGVTQIRKVVENPDAALAASALEAVKQWRYEPAVCNGRPVPSETIVEVNYTLSH